MDKTEDLTASDAEINLFPHSWQNFASSGFSCRHLGHFIIDAIQILRRIEYKGQMSRTSGSQHNRGSPIGNQAGTLPKTASRMESKLAFLQAIRT